MRVTIISAVTLVLGATVGTQTWAQTADNWDGLGEGRGHRGSSIFVDSQVGPGGDGSRGAPYQTIAQAMERARQIREETRGRIVVRVAPGNYIQDSPIYLDVSNFELRGSTRLIKDDDGLPKNCGSDTAPTPCLRPGTETVIAPTRPLAANNQVMLFVAPTTDTPAERLTDVAIRGFVFDGRASNVTTGGVAIFVDRVENFSVRNNVTRRVVIGVFTRLASGRIKGHFGYESNDGLALAGGSRIYPANVEVSSSRLIGNLQQGVVALGTANSRSVIRDPHVKPVQTVFDPAGHPEQVPNRLTLAVVGNDMSNSPRFGMRLENYISGGSYDTTDNQAMTSHINATIRGNSFRNNGEYGVTVEGAFATRANPRLFTGTFDGSFEDNDLAGSGRAGLFVGFMLNGVVTRNPGLINQFKYLRDSRFTIEMDEETSVFGIDYDNPVLDRFDRITPLNNTLIINGVPVTGTQVTCPPGFPCFP